MVLLHKCQSLPLPGSLASHCLCHKNWSHDSVHLGIPSTFIVHTDINIFKMGAGMHSVNCQLKPRNFCLYWHIFKKQQFIFLFFFFPVALWSKVGHGLLILEVSRSHMTMHHSCLCDVTLTHPLCAHGRSWMYCCTWQKSLLNSYPWAIKPILNFHIPFSLRSFRLHLT